MPTTAVIRLRLRRNRDDTGGVLRRRSVADVCQVQALRRGDRPAGPAVAGGQGLGHVGGGPAADPHLGEGPGHRADLAVQEGARGELQDHLLAVAADVGHVQGLHRRLRLAVQVAEGGEVVVAHQHLRRRVHGRRVQRLHMTNVEALFFASLSHLYQGMVANRIDGADEWKAMSKSLGNGVDPDEMISAFGADATRLFVLFAAPVENELRWSETGIEGAVRFLRRVYTMVWRWQERFMPRSETTNEFTAEARTLRRKTHQTIAKITSDFEHLHLNTSVAALMELFNQLSDFDADPATASK